MRQGQKSVLWIGLFVLIATLLFPPWESAIANRGFVGYAWLFDPPQRANIDPLHWAVQTALLAAVFWLAYVLAGRTAAPAAAGTAWRWIWRLLATGVAAVIATALGWGAIVGGLFGLSIILIWRRPRAEQQDPKPAERMNWTTGLSSDDTRRIE